MPMAGLLALAMSIFAVAQGFTPRIGPADTARRLTPLKAASVSEISSPVRPMFSARNALAVDVLQVSSGRIPRGYLPGLIRLSRAPSSGAEAVDYRDVESAIGFYLDGGGRIGKLYVVTPIGDIELQRTVEEMGFQPLPSAEIADAEVKEMLILFKLASEFRIFSCVSNALRSHCEERLLKSEGSADVLHDIVGRLLHDSGNPKEAINSYTAALLVNPSSAALFRNLGSAYHACGDMQLAFASYQQALTVDSKDLLVYLKLAYLYEDLASKEWAEAAEHAEKCYRFYLDNVDAEDTSVLTRLGNLLMKEHEYEDAASVYLRALSLDDKLHNVWFNLAHSQVSIIECLAATYVL